MASSRFLFFLCCLLSTQVVPLITLAQPEMLYHDCLPGKGNYSANSSYQENLNQLLTSIYNNTEIDSGFYNLSYGQDPDKVYANGLCRPDITPESCRACLKGASEHLTTLCPNSKEAIGGSDNCMLRYTYRSIFGMMEGGPYFFVYSLNIVSDLIVFKQSRRTLLDRLRDQAAAGNSRYKYATGDTDVSNSSQKIYALVQCTPDLSKQQCSDCLSQATGLLSQCCDERQGGRIITPSCNFRYEINLFYDPAALGKPEKLPTLPVPAAQPSPPPTSTGRTGKVSNIAPTLIIGSFPMLFFFML
ncbi:hypothetical protein P3X46_028672 [Hevea brasiliensis]|uniref:Gnk2-homologous domain-containing protein n=1 Tax=Hevea brasiliensis TaxID=3981 RepID=A0ABQ9KT62_HEVBR|nr:cysteine-rich repeat secretory protein 38-like [Hevea brasiliensis]KAJ9146402.1 hypothetical protein P3X46_028672 [Hevea brasiliensis]